MAKLDDNEKVMEIVYALSGHFEKKFEKDQKKQEKLGKAFLEQIINKAIERTNQELEQINLPKFQEIHQNKLLYHDEFKEAIYIFEMYLQNFLSEIKRSIINAFWEG